MKALLIFLSGMTLMGLLMTVNAKAPHEPYILQHEAAIARMEPGPHQGTGQTMAYPFFEQVKDLGWIFRKRTLKPGASIGYHLQQEDEIYYLLKGEGIMLMNGDSLRLKAGDAVLTRPGSSHGFIANNETEVLISYLRK